MSTFLKIMDATVEALKIILAISVMLLCMACLLLIVPFYLPVYIYRKWRENHDK